MERQFALPIAFAAAAHAALLFGFSRPPSIPPPKEISVISDWPLPPPPDDPPEPVVSESKNSEPPERPDIAPPRQAEPAPIDMPTTFTQPVPPVPPFDPANLDRVAPTRLASSEELGSRIGNVVPSGMLDNKPRARFQARPQYPPQARREGLAGEVLVEFVVNETGEVINPRVVQSSNPVFEESAMRAVAKWRFEPGRRDNKIVSFRMSVPIVFTLSE